jgi:CubicO group peptidase (beta-lactamase class C family)
VKTNRNSLAARIARAAFGLALGLGLAACAAPWSPAAWDSAALRDLAEYAKAQKTTGFMIVEDQKIIHEVNWPLSGADATFAANWTHGTDSHGGLQEDVASAQKSFIGLLAAIAIDKGLLDISKPVTAYVGAGWSKASPAQEQAITVQHLLEMSSGLTEPLAYEAPAGSRFFYNTPAYAILKPVLEKASKQSLEDITRLWLTEPAGLADTLWRKRPSTFGDVGNPTGLYTTPRDMVKLGQLLLDKGVAANGRRVISQEQLAALFTRSANNPAYGRLWWLNGSAYTLRPGLPRTETSIIPAAPADLIMALGALHRKIYVSPSRRLIVVRTGQAAPDRNFDQQLWLHIMKARSESVSAN